MMGKVGGGEPTGGLRASPAPVVPRPAVLPLASTSAVSTAGLSTAAPVSPQAARPSQALPSPVVKASERVSGLLVGQPTYLQAASTPPSTRGSSSSGDSKGRGSSGFELELGNRFGCLDDSGRGDAEAGVLRGSGLAGGPAGSWQGSSPGASGGAQAASESMGTDGYMREEQGIAKFLQALEEGVPVEDGGEHGEGAGTGDESTGEEDAEERAVKKSAAKDKTDGLSAGVPARQTGTRPGRARHPPARRGKQAVIDASAGAASSVVAPIGWRLWHLLAKAGGNLDGVVSCEAPEAKAAVMHAVKGSSEGLVSSTDGGKAANAAPVITKATKSGRKAAGRSLLSPRSRRGLCWHSWIHPYWPLATMCWQKLESQSYLRMGAFLHVEGCRQGFRHGRPVPDLAGARHPPARRGKQAVIDASAGAASSVVAPIGWRLWHLLAKAGGNLDGVVSCEAPEAKAAVMHAVKGSSEGLVSSTDGGKAANAAPVITKATKSGRKAAGGDSVGIHGFTLTGPWQQCAGRNSSLNRTYAWAHFCMWKYGINVPGFQETLEEFPPTIYEWEAFRLWTRARTSSYDAFRTNWGYINTIGTEYWAAKPEGEMRTREQCSPVVIYSARHKKGLAMIRRAWPVRLRECEPITMDEARSGPHFCDESSVIGVFHGAAWMMGVVLGGKRSRTLVAMRAGDVVFRVARRRVGGSGGKQRIVEVVVSFREEKYDNKYGPRALVDNPPDNMAEGEVKESFGYWAYKLFQARGLFDTKHPMMEEALGATFQVRDECKEFYVFCRLSGLVWVDTLPPLTADLSRWTGQLLSRMGSEKRGFSAHRSGYVTRAVTKRVMETGGTEIPESFVAALTRSSGWEAGSGQKNRDENILSASSGLAYKYTLVGPGEEWHRGCVEGKEVGQSVCVRELQGLLNAAGRKAVATAVGDMEIMPLRRYVEDGNAVRKLKRKCPEALEDVEALMERLQKVVTTLLGRRGCRLGWQLDRSSWIVNGAGD
eukprot:jgi/Botrbrau1/21666/Bobra.43_1s0065.1